jgi:hypothetical protein
VGFRQRIPFDAKGVLVLTGMLIACYVYAFAVYLMFERNTRRVQQRMRRLQSGHTAPDTTAAHVRQRGTIT